MTFKILTKQELENLILDAQEDFQIEENLKFYDPISYQKAERAFVRYRIKEFYEKKQKGVINNGNRKSKRTG